MSPSLVCRFFCKVVISVLTLPFVCASMHGVDVEKPVFIKGSCLAPISTNVMLSFKEEIGKSRRYRLIRDMSDEGRMDLVVAINISCTERNDVAAIAIVFGRAKCFSATNCHHAVDGSSIKSDLCELSSATDCGKMLFRFLDDYVNNPDRSALKLN